jgi:hypothetical protein
MPHQRRSIHRSSIHRSSRREIVKTTMKLAAIGSLGVGYGAIARAKAPTGPGVGTFSHIDAMLRAATSAGEAPGIVALAATDNDIVYEGIFGRRRLHARDHSRLSCGVADTQLGPGFWRTSSRLSNTVTPMRSK